MEYEKLVVLLREWDIIVVTKAEKLIRGHDVDTFRSLARQAAQIDFDCDFHNGRCNGRASAGNGCCTFDGCAISLGYWRKEGGTVDEDTLGKIADIYDEKTGFLKDGEGCRLPWELRSPTCLFIYCSGAMMTDGDKILLRMIKHGPDGLP
jgi:hypothetical protein